MEDSIYWIITILFLVMILAAHALYAIATREDLEQKILEQTQKLKKMEEQYRNLESEYAAREAKLNKALCGLENTLHAERSARRAELEAAKRTSLESLLSLKGGA